MKTRHYKAHSLTKARTAAPCLQLQRRPPPLQQAEGSPAPPAPRRTSSEAVAARPGRAGARHVPDQVNVPRTWGGRAWAGRSRARRGLPSVLTLECAVPWALPRRRHSCGLALPQPERQLPSQPTARAGHAHLRPELPTAGRAPPPRRPRPSQRPGAAPAPSPGCRAEAPHLKRGCQAPGCAVLGGPGAPLSESRPPAARPARSRRGARGAAGVGSGRDRPAERIPEPRASPRAACLQRGRDRGCGPGQECRAGGDGPAERARRLPRAGADLWAPTPVPRACSDPDKRGPARPRGTAPEPAARGGGAGTGPFPGRGGVGRAARRGRAAQATPRALQWPRPVPCLQPTRYGKRWRSQLTLGSPAVKRGPHGALDS